RPRKFKTTATTARSGLFPTLRRRSPFWEHPWREWKCCVASSSPASHPDRAELNLVFRKALRFRRAFVFFGVKFGQRTCVSLLAAPPNPKAQETRNLAWLYR